ncbi:MAG: hypothetical protein JF593_08595 [Novosphingobium sp.]|nr:hypothetical protein [Novosphingobium sp.]
MRWIMLALVIVAALGVLYLMFSARQGPTTIGPGHPVGATLRDCAGQRNAAC